MSISYHYSMFNLTPDQIKYLAKLRGSTTLEEDVIVPKQPKTWVLSGFYSFTYPYLPSDLAVQHNIKLHNFRNDIVGLILPYPHGFDQDPLMGVTNINIKFLHLFNVGDVDKKISRIFEGVEFKNLDIPSKKRIILALR